ncbi:MAG TPA: hypothetical protein V6D14_25110 [Coleofasciculaceae cyanobacterium]|jgi:hypothetical protein
MKPNFVFHACLAGVSALSMISGFSTHAVASEIETQDIILSANGAAGSQDWEYNAAQSQGWVQYMIHWQPTRRVQKVQWRCVDNCQDANKFEYRVKFNDGKMVLVMRATNKQQGLIRVQLTALVD